ncbi:hypothetical protein LIER_24490 [Lithospermum erythrorhizon]|uniref:Uncharacterized protein n=1 Tax=Lithospermum erythrorhizon TaxID=34254 RepID=A0AAV3R5B3_LITER
MALGVEGLEEQHHFLKKEVFKISKRVTRIGEKLKVDMGLNFDEEDEASEDIEEEDDESIHDILGSDENKDNDSKDGVSLDNDDDNLDIPKFDKEVLKDDAELSEGHSEEPVNKGKGPAATSEDIAEDDSNDVPQCRRSSDEIQQQMLP